MAFIVCLSLYILGNFHVFCRQQIFFKINFLKKIFQITFRVSNGLDPDQAVLGSNRLKRSSADDKIRC